MREQILTFLEKNSRIDPKELAILLGSDEVTIMNEIAKMEEEKVICGCDAYREKSEYRSARTLHVLRSWYKR